MFGKIQWSLFGLGFFFIGRFSIIDSISILIIDLVLLFLFSTSMGIFFIYIMFCLQKLEKINRTFWFRLWTSKLCTKEPYNNYFRLCRPKGKVQDVPQILIYYIVPVTAPQFCYYSVKAEKKYINSWLWLHAC